MISETALWALLEARAAATPDALMAVDDEGGSLRFAELRDRARVLAAGLQAAGVRPDATVSWQLPTRLEALLVVAALARLGVRQNPLLPLYRKRELSFITHQCRPSHLIVPRAWRGVDYEGLAAEVAEEVGEVEPLVLDGSALPEGDPAALPPYAPDAHAVRWIFYSSGTTADPKGALHSDFGVGCAARNMTERYAIDERDRASLVFPFTHIGGIEWVFVSLHVGARLLFTDRFVPDETIPFLAREGVTLAGAGTPFHLAYLEAQRRDPSRPLFPEVRVFAGGGAAKPPSLHDELKAELGGAGIVAGWGLTEFPNIAMCSVDDDDEVKARTEGRPTAGVELRVRRVDGSEARPGEEGELRARGPHCCLGFVDPELAAEAFDEEGFLRTGDLGYVTPEGCVVITGRLKDVIVRKGENISAKEVEDLLYTHPSVADVAVVGVPDPALGERCCAVVVVADAAPSPDLSRLVAFLDERGLMKQKQPEQLEVVDALPRNSAGKVRKDLLRDRFADRGPAA